MRKQSQIWSDTNSSEVQKMRAESELLTGQLAVRNADLASLRQQLTGVEADRVRALLEKQQVSSQRLALLNAEGVMTIQAYDFLHHGDGQAEPGIEQFCKLCSWYRLARAPCSSNARVWRK